MLPVVAMPALCVQADTGGGHFRVGFGLWAAGCMLRPETIESLFMLWRATGKQHYREWGWQIFRALEMHARLESGGYASIESVTAHQASHVDSTESFFLAETLKYLLLLFSDDKVRPVSTKACWSCALLLCCSPCSASAVSKLISALCTHSLRWLLAPT
jgi:Glycosyl hydrolase family 47